MKDPAQIGSQGEKLAVAFLKRRGFEILEKNWRFKRLEIDIIAQHSSVLVFVEVKSRSSSNFYAPETSITKAKWDNIARAAGNYMETIGYEWEVRFDVISVVFDSHNRHSIKHFFDVSFPGRY